MLYFRNKVAYKLCLFHFLLWLKIVFSLLFEYILQVRFDLKVQCGATVTKWNLSIKHELPFFDFLFLWSCMVREICLRVVVYDTRDLFTRGRAWYARSVYAWSCIVRQICLRVVVHSTRDLFTRGRA